MGHDSLGRELLRLAWHWALSLAILVGPYLLIRLAPPLAWQPMPGEQEAFDHFLSDHLRD